MNKRSWLSLILVAALCCGSLSGTALAAVADEAIAATVNLDGKAQQQLLEQLIPAVRQKVGVPETLERFSSDYWSGSEGGNFYLRWWSDTNDKSISVTVLPNGEIVNLYKYNYRTDYSRQHFAALSKEEAKKKADELLQSLAPEIISQLSPEATVIYSRYDGYQVSYQRVIDGVPVQYQFLNLSVDADTGELRSLNRSWQSSSFVSVENQDKLISPEKASQAFRNKIGLKLHYQLVYDYSSSVRNPEPQVILEYTWNDYQRFCIDAKTGELYIPPTYEDAVFGKGGGGAISEEMAYDLAAPASGRAMLTPEEQKHVDSLKDLISAETALTKLLSLPYLDLDETFTLGSAQYYYGYQDREQITLSLNLNSGDEKNQRYAYAQFDAKTCELLSFSMYSYSYQSYAVAGSEVGGIKREAAQATAEAFLKQVKPQLWTQVKLQTATTDYPSYAYYNNAFSFRYNRQVQNLPFEQNGLNVTIDRFTGKITGFSQSWNEKLTFPDKTKVISEDKAYAALLAVEEPALYYFAAYNQGGAKTSASAQVSLSYDAKLIYSAELLPGLSVNATSGEILQYGSAYKVKNTSFSYADLDGHQEAAKIHAVAEHLGFEAMEEFRPEAQITQIEWLRWVTLLSRGWMDTDDNSFYRNTIMNGWISEEERNPDATLTALDGVKYLMRSLDMGYYAKIARPIFVNPYKLDNEQAAYVALAAGVNAIDMDGFDPKAPLTRCEAALLLYNYLSR